MDRNIDVFSNEIATNFYRNFWKIFILFFPICITMMVGDNNDDGEDNDASDNNDNGVGDDDSDNDYTV
jgi:hypothetical protein